MDIGITSLQTYSIEAILSRKVTYKLPTFQREYSWTKNEWSQLWDDAISSVANRTGHFFGFMTFKEESYDKYSIIEGQQRLSTITILICAIRDFLEENNNQIGNNLDNEFVKTADTYSIGKSKSYRIQLEETNNTFFKKYIQTNGRPLDKIDGIAHEKRVSPSNKLIGDCYRYFYERVREYEKQNFDGIPGRPIVGLIQSVGLKFVVVSTEVKDELVAYNIFQTLNNRGLELSLTDLIKVYLFRTAGNKLEDAKIRWNNIKQNLNNANPNSFFRHFWLSNNSLVRETELLQIIQGTITDNYKAITLLDHLQDESEIYEALLNPSNDYWKDKDILELLTDLQLLSKQTPLPVLLSAAKKIYPNNKNQFKKIIIYLTNHIFRYLTVAERENKALEKLLSDISIQIRNETITNSDEVLNALIKERVDDDTFKYLVVDKDFKKASVARYILMSIEKMLERDMEKFSSEMTLEHILPRNPDTDWKKYCIENSFEAEDWIYKIGNMTLLLGKPNRKAQNKFFNHKSSTYKKSSKLNLNRNLLDLTSWNQMDIKERTWQIADWANLTWHYEKV